MLKQLFSTLIILTIFISDAHADDDKRKGTKLHLSSTESVEVQEDLLVVNLRYEIEGETPQEVQKKINQGMSKALSEAKKNRKVAVSTEHYSVYKYHPRVKKSEQSKPIWKGSQSMQIKSKDADSALNTTSALQSIGLAVNGLNYVVSPDLREKTKDSLMEQAIDKLISKAKRVAKAIGKDDIEIINISIDSNNYSHDYSRSSNMMMKSMDVSESMPVAAPGQARVSTTIRASILIKD